MTFCQLSKLKWLSVRLEEDQCWHREGAGPQFVMDEKSRTVAASDYICPGYFGSRGSIFIIFFGSFDCFNAYTFPKGFSPAL